MQTYTWLSARTSIDVSLQLVKVACIHSMTPVKGGDKSEVAQWIPEPFNLREGNPFEYSQHTISSASGTEAFEAGIQTRDGDFCVVCGQSQLRILNYCHIIPKIERDTVRYKLLFYHTRTDHGTVGGNEGHWFCTSKSKGCGA